METELKAKSIRVFSQDGLTPLPVPDIFGNTHPVEVDLGCGKGRFLLAHAADHPQINYLGIDRMLRRIRRVDRKIVRFGLANVRLFRMEAYYAVAHLLPANSITTYFILFPDPWPKKKHQRHRLFDGPFLEALYRTLVPGGRVHVATDHLPYFEAMQASFTASGRFDRTDTWTPKGHERTDFELLYLDQKEIGRASYTARAMCPVA